MQMLTPIAAAVAVFTAPAVARDGTAEDNRLEQLETAKWHPSSLGGMAAVSKLFAREFVSVEYGSDFNGLVYRKQGMERSRSGDLAKLGAALDATKFQLTEWKVLHPSPTVTVLSYRVTAPELRWTAYATSIWARRGEVWKTVFYQASHAQPAQ
jgi:hypothetical protein